MVNIYVGKLSYDTTEDDLRQAFAPYGKVDRVSIVMDRMTNRSKGFGFVEMPNTEEAKAAMNALNNTELQGRKIVVNEARPKEDQGPRRNR